MLAWRTTFASHILRVLARQSQPQMAWANAAGCIAVVTYKPFLVPFKAVLGQWADKQFIQYSMGWTPRSNAIASRTVLAHPEPASWPYIH